MTILPNIPSLPPIPSQAVFKYETQISGLSDCPPVFAKVNHGAAFRWVNNPQTSSCFTPQAIRNPKRLNDASKACDLWGLSMHTSEEASLTTFLFLEKSIKKLRKNVGDHISSGQITKQSGLCTDPDQYNHFNIYEFAGNDFRKTFNIIQHIP